MRPIQFTLNGKPVTVDVNAKDRLLDVLRLQLGCYEVKEGCGEGECGACTVLLDGAPVTTCILLAWQVSGRNITTVKGIPEAAMERIERVMRDEHAVQCGFCTPGFVLTIYSLVKNHPHPKRDEIQLAMSGNLCRCTGYEAIFRAVERLAAEGGVA